MRVLPNPFMTEDHNHDNSWQDHNHDNSWQDHNHDNSWQDHNHDNSWLSPNTKALLDETMENPMSLFQSRPCTCGSGKPSKWQYDARLIPLCRTCEDCHEARMARYRPDVLNDPNYWHDEDIEED